MPAITSETIQRFFNQGEVDASQKVPFLIDRYSPALVTGQSTYLLPDYVSSIRRVTYMGAALDPLPQRNLREVFEGATQQGVPYWYIYNNVGLSKIQLFPVPYMAVAAGVNIWSTDIATSLIIEFARIADNNTFTIPPYIRRQLLKRFVSYKVHLIEGPLHDLKMAEHYEEQWKAWLKMFEEHIHELHTRNRRLVIGDASTNIAYPAAPILPIDRFGISVDDGY